MLISVQGAVIVRASDDETGHCSTVACSRNMILPGVALISWITESWLYQDISIHID